MNDRELAPHLDWTDPTGTHSASVRDTLAASFGASVAAAQFAQGIDWKLINGGDTVVLAYRMADQFLAERHRLAELQTATRGRGWVSKTGTLSTPEPVEGPLT